MTQARGRGAMTEAAQEMKNRGGSSYTRLLMLKTGEKCLVRFRGYVRPLPTHTEDRLRTMTLGMLRALCRAWGVFEHGLQQGGEGEAARIVKLSPSEASNVLVERLVARQDNLEPFTLYEDYIHGNQSGRKYVTCAEKWHYAPGSCVSCHMRAGGDRRISQKLGANFSVVPQRFYHYIRAENKDDNEFAYCSNYGYDAGGGCTYCAIGDVPKQEGMKRFSIANTHTQTLFGMDDRIALRCAACRGVGKIQHASWACSDCGELMDLTGLSSQQRERPVKCPSCQVEGIPLEEVTCTRGCAAARRAQLFDYDVLIQKFGTGKNTTYGFTEQECEPAHDEILQFQIPSWERTLAPGDTDNQCRKIGLPRNPFTGTQVNSAGPAAGAVSYEQDGPGDELVSDPADIPF
jgi:DNA-directed RNA polymerase subunit RPC12/RpoP